MENHVTLEGLYVGSYKNKAGDLCIKVINKYKGLEYDRDLDTVNKYFTIKVTNSREIKKVESLKFNSLILIDGHLKMDVHIHNRPEKVVQHESYKQGIYCDSLMELEV